MNKVLSDFPLDVEESFFDQSFFWNSLNVEWYLKWIFYHVGRFTEPLNLGLLEYHCRYCGALFWHKEHIWKSWNTSRPIFSLCCRKGRVDLPLLKDTPAFLDTLLASGGRRALKFWENIRIYNSIFAFMSIGAKIDNEINNKQGPYVFRINGQNHHRMGSLREA